MNCIICPHNCYLFRGETGKCLVRQGHITSPFNAAYGRISSLAVEPIESRPFFHFRPGKGYLSVGFYGCNLRCRFCANHEVSQTAGQGSQTIQPAEMLMRVLIEETDGIAFTYNEPGIHLDYIREVNNVYLHRFSDKNIYVVVKTNGFLSLGAIYDLAANSDAINVDIKGDEQVYNELCSASFVPVKAAIEAIGRMNTHLEISYLVLPQLVHNLDFHSRTADWLAGIRETIPIHILYFFPAYKMTGESYEPEELLPIIGVFKERLRYVYVSNLFTVAAGFDLYRDTRCNICGSVMIDRQKKTEVIKTECCGTKVDFVK